MAFVTKTWKDRLVEYAGRRRLKNVATGEEILMDVSRSEGTVNQAGDAFSAANMNNLEQRIKTEFDSVNSSLQDQPTFEYDESGKITGYKTKIGGADTVFPFSGGNVSFDYSYSADLCQNADANVWSRAYITTHFEIKDGVITISGSGASSSGVVSNQISGTYVRVFKGSVSNVVKS